MVVLSIALTATACSDASNPDTHATSSPSLSASPSPSPTPTSPPQPPPLGGLPPPWLGTRPLPLRADGFGEVRPTPPELRHRRFTLPDIVDPLPGRGFASRVDPVPPDVLSRSTWQPGCPVTADELRWVRLAFWGFDDVRHTGELLVNAAVADDLVSVFRALYEARYPIEEMRVTRLDELDAPPTGDGNDTGAFACRATIGRTSFSQHAYGLAIDVNPFQNPYVKGGPGPARARVVVPRPGRPSRRSPRRRRRRHGLRIDRLGVGRQLADAEGLPALLTQRNLKNRGVRRARRTSRSLTRPRTPRGSPARRAGRSRAG